MLGEVKVRRREDRKTLRRFSVLITSGSTSAGLETESHQSWIHTEPKSYVFTITYRTLMAP